MVFADIRGSTQLAEGQSPTAFGALVNRFYRTSTDVLNKADGMVEKLAGDAVAAFFIPALSANPPLAAVHAAQKLLEVTGHADSQGPWIPVGVGVHTGMAWMGVVGEEDGLRQFAVLGDTVNVGARLSTNAAVGEILVSHETMTAAGLDLKDGEYRQLDLKGKSEPVDVQVLRVDANLGVK